MAGADLIVHSTQPFNAEPPLERLRASFLTPQRDLYIRSHGDVPHLDAATHTVTVASLVTTPLRLTVAELQAGFAHRTATAVLQCAGNRRADLHRVAPVSGDPWAGGAIGNADWTGVALADVLQAAGAATGGDRHVVFDAADQVTTDGKTFRYGVSIPTAKALSPEVLLAWAVNGEPLTPEHGYPLRVVVPGFAGVRSPKWLSAITVQDTPSDNPMQAQDYKLYPSDVTKATADPAKGITINEMPVNATICEPARLAVLPKGPTAVRGYATATGGAVVRVDVSPDGGQTWLQARLEAATAWSWTLWSAVLDLPPGDHVLAVRAWDAAGQTQPSRPEDVWNHRGYLSTAWHRIPVHVED